MTNNIFSDSLLLWFDKNQRKLPWRETKDPYIIWLSEVILQQTRVAQGLPYFEKFAHRFPTIADLAKAEEDEILKMWQGLGYYSRARNMLKTAKQVVKSGYPFPTEYKELILLKGIGEYTASAIASFSSNEKVAVVDGNVYRVLSRYFGIEEPIDSTLGKKTFKETAINLLPTTNCNTYNQAIMEFGALQCKPKSPDCSMCPLALNCLALKNSKVNELPIKAKKQKKKKIELQYIVFKFQQYVMIRQRKGLGVWEGLYDFPSIETNLKITDELLLEKASTAFNVPELNLVRTGKKFKHVLSHIDYVATFWEAHMDTKQPVEIPNCKWIKIDQIGEFPVSRLVEKYLEA